MRLVPTFTTSDGVEIRYEVRGSSGPVVFGCQGGPNNICDTLMKDLAPLESSCTFVFHDYRGSGKSAEAPADSYRFERLADDLDELRQHLGYDKVGVLAHSMGGFIALNFALRHPEHCERLALIGTTPCGKSGPMLVPTIKALGPARAARALALLGRFLVLFSWRRSSPAKTEALYAPMSVTQEPRRELRALVKNAHPEMGVKNFNSDDLMKAVGSVDLRNDLSRIKCPVLVLYGSRDSVMVAGGQMLTAGISQADVHVLPEIGHEPFIECPDAAVAIVRPFLTSGP
jgi:pimeloyl-ACP methyl ester carboxylesterase